LWHKSELLIHKCQVNVISQRRELSLLTTTHKSETRLEDRHRPPAMYKVPKVIKRVSGTSLCLPTWLAKSELQGATFLVYNSHTLMSVNCNSWQSDLLNDALNLDWKKVDKNYSKDYKLRTFTQVYNLVHKRHTSLLHYTALFFWKIHSPGGCIYPMEKSTDFQLLPFWSVMKPILCKAKGMMVNVILYATARVACIQMRARG
jgi:hypothetical protein